jgi:uncharacterized protein (TIGR03435 family)
MSAMRVRVTLGFPAGAVITAGAVASAVLALVVTIGAAQQAAAPAFEVASVKSSAPAAGPLGQMPRLLPPVGGRFTALNMPLRALVRLAYGLHDSQIAGGPPWLAQARFDVTAKADNGTAPNLEAMAPMLKALLADRFALQVHIEPRELPTLALVVARADGALGRALKPSSTDCTNAEADARRRLDALARGGPAALAALMPRPGEVVPCALSPMVSGSPGSGFGLRANGMPMQTLVTLLTQATGRLVRDQTGLTGLFDWELTFDPQVMFTMAQQAGITLPPGVSLPPSDSPSLFTALQEELGLKLDGGRSMVDVLVIDRAQMPAPD